MARAREPLSFAQQLDRLEEIVRRLETQELDLDEALKLFEEGIERLREARERLAAAGRPPTARATAGPPRGRAITWWRSAPGCSARAWSRSRSSRRVAARSPSSCSAPRARGA